MPKPRLRTRSKKRANVTLPSGLSRTHYKMRTVPTSSCSMCGQPLPGIPHLIPVKMRKLNRTRRRIGRPYGGELCHNCLKKAMKQGARTL